MKRIIGVNSNCYHGYSIDDAIDGIQAAGFHYIELTATKGWTEHVFPSQSFAELLRIKNRLEKAKLIPFALSGHCNLMDKERLQDFISNIELASFFKCDYIVSSVGEAHLEDKTLVSNAAAVENIKGLIPLLQKHRMKLVLETHGGHATGVILEEIVDLIHSEWVAINYDTANVVFYADADIRDDLSACADQVGYLHLKDKDGASDEWNFPALGTGRIDFPMIFDVLEQHHNMSPFSVEIEFTKAGAKNVKEVNQAVKTSADYLKSCGFEI